MEKTKILIVDDNQGLCGALEEVLNDSYCIICAHDPVEAREKLKEHSAGLIILDNQLPDKDGEYLIPEIRKDHPSMPIVFLTGYGSEKLAVRVTSHGNVFYQIKSDLIKLGQFVNRILPCENLIAASDGKEIPEIVSTVMKYVKLNYSKPLTLRGLSKRFKIDSRKLNGLFEGALFESVKEYVNGTRIAESRQLLVETEDSIKSIAKQVGLSHRNYFNLFFKLVKLTPQQYRKRFA